MTEPTLYQHLPVSLDHNGPVPLVRHFRPVQSAQNPERLFATFRGRNLSGIVESAPSGYYISPYARDAASPGGTGLVSHPHHNPAPAFVRWMWDADPTIRTTATLPRSLDTFPEVFGAMASEVSAETVKSIIESGLPSFA